MSNSTQRKMVKTIQVRATIEEKANLKSRADAFGISLGQLVRDTIFRTQPKSVTDQKSICALANARAELGRVGGLLKGLLVGTFPNSHQFDKGYAQDLLRQVEAAQIDVVAAVKTLVGKS